MRPLTVTGPSRPLLAVHRFAERAAPTANRIVLGFALSWLAFVVAASAGLAALVWATGAPPWAYVLVAAFGILLVSPVLAPVFAALAAIRGARHALARAAAAEEHWLQSRTVDPRLRP